MYGFMSMIAGSRMGGSDQGDGGVVAQGVGGGEGEGVDGEGESDAWLYESDSLVSGRATRTNEHECVRLCTHTRTYAHRHTHAYTRAYTHKHTHMQTNPSLHIDT